MIKKVLALILLIIVLLPSPSIGSTGSPCAEVVDLAQNRIAKSVQVDSEIYDMAKCWIKSIDNFYGRINPLPVEGYKVRIPLDPAVSVNKKSLTAEISEIYIIVPPNKPPFLMIYEANNKLSYFKFHGNIDSLSKVLDFKLRN